MKTVTMGTAAQKVHTTKYDKFKGADFSTDPSLIAESRSPYAPNMISDTGGSPEKRVGWRKLWQIDSPVNGLYYGAVGANTFFLAHGGTKLYRWDENTAPVVIYSNINNGKSTMFAMSDKLWILTGAEYLVYDGTDVKAVSDISYAPMTVIARTPSGGGTPYERVNLVGKRRKNSFQSNGTSTIYQLDAIDIDADIVELSVNGTALAEGAGFTVNRAAGQITFTTAPTKPAVDGSDNVVVSFCKTVAGYGERIAKCTIAAMYGVGTSDRVFFSGNAAYRNWDWYTALNDPSYIADLDYSNVGVSGTAIMGYRRIGSYLAIIKEDNGQDSTIFLRSAETSGGKALFPLKQGIAGVGAVSKYAFANLMDEPLFLASTGVYAITSNTITAERTVQNRSYYIDAKMTKEENLKEAVAIEWKGYYLLGIGNRCYILDGKQNKAYKPQSSGDYVYECYHWENIPAVCFMNHKTEGEEALYFGTANGRICRMNDDVARMDKYWDYPDGIGGTGVPVVACWSTKSDDDGDVSRLKTMTKKGNSVTLKPYTRSSAKVCFRTDKDAVDWQARYDTMDIFDWGDIDFSRITFDSNDTPREVFFRRKVKKYKRLQIIIRNDAGGEGFGVFGIQKHYTTGNYAKR